MKADFSSDCENQENGDITSARINLMKNSKMKNFFLDYLKSIVNDFSDVEIILFLMTEVITKNDNKIWYLV